MRPDVEEFFCGISFDAYRLLGSHPAGPGRGWLFTLWAPHARRVQLLGDWNGWDLYSAAELTFCEDGLWRGRVPHAQLGQLYKYNIQGPDGSWQLRADPFAFAFEALPGTASRLAEPNYPFAAPLLRGARRDAPVLIYELHAASWHRHWDGRYYTGPELAKSLVPYLVEHHYTHVEFLPLAEYPFDGSWGYQTTGFFAPTSRYGTPDELVELVNACHKQGIGVILDFVPVHFAVDAYGLKEFDGTPLYEYPAAAVGQSEWGSCNFMHSRGEIRCFIQSCADYWLRVFHADGLRMDAVSRLIYWQGDPNRGVNGSTLEFLKGMNAGLQQRHPTAILIAEDSTSFPKVTAPVEYGGLGFDYKWDLGWMNDTLDYFKKTSDERRENLGKLTFSMMYAWNEHYILPFSHDENVHGKATIVQKMYGEYEGKFPQARALYLYMAIHPGKMLDFMGNEFAQLREFDESREQDWMLLKYPNHDDFHRYRRALNEAYLANEAFWSREYDPEAFRWLDCAHPELDACAIWRDGHDGAVLASFNFGDTELADYTLTLPRAGKLTKLLDTDWQCFGGRTEKPKRLVGKACGGEWKLTLAPFSGQLFKLV